MKKNLSRIFAFAMTAVVMFSVSPAVTSQAATKKLGSETVYMTSAEGYTSFEMENVKSASSIKSSKPAVFKPTSYYLYNYAFDNYYLSGNSWKKSDFDTSSSYLNLSGKAMAGTTKVSVVSGKTTYVKNVTFKKYVNPLKKLIVSNVNSGKNIAGRFKSSNSASVSGKKADAVKVQAQAAKGWEISEIYISNSSNDVGPASYRYFKKGTTKGENTLNHYDHNRSAHVSVYCVNKANKGKLTVSVNINGN